MKIMKYKMFSSIINIIILLLLSLPIYAHAQNLPCQTASAIGSYSHPKNGTIEDSGGENNEALGQSMVSKVVDQNALIETTPSGNYLISIRLHMMDSISDVKLYTQSLDTSGWSAVSYEKTISQEEYCDFRFSASDTNVIIKAECKVEAMGRYVIFYISFTDFIDGNAGNFVQMSDSVPETLSSAIVNANNTNEENEDLSQVVTESSTSVKQDILTDPLQNVEGMTIGFSSTLEKGSNPDNNSIEQIPSVENSLLPQPLNISGQVWFMFFIILFCANLLSGLSIWGIKMLLQRTNIRETTMSAEETDEGEYDLSYLDLLAEEVHEVKDEENM